MKKCYYSILIDTSKLGEADMLRDIWNNIRFMNMSAHSKGFAGNKGLTDDFFLQHREFVWVFESKEKRGRAIKRLNQLISKNVLHTLKITTSMSPSRASRCNSIRVPKLSASLRIKWLGMKSMSAVTTSSRHAS
ncbi:hypothetical protein EV46_14340 [Pectobacterium atrosepticum]|nr:hypothetical protein EV46_14340 [Pectobacterium atrosepticum]